MTDELIVIQNIFHLLYIYLTSHTPLLWTPTGLTAYGTASKGLGQFQLFFDFLLLKYQWTKYNACSMKMWEVQSIKNAPTPRNAHAAKAKSATQKCHPAETSF